MAFNPQPANARNFMDKVVERFVEGLIVVLSLTFAAVWDALISPEWNGTPLPILLTVAILILVIFAPRRWTEELPRDGTQ